MSVTKTTFVELKCPSSMSMICSESQLKTVIQGVGLVRGHTQDADCNIYSILVFHLHNTLHYILSALRHRLVTNVPLVNP